MVSMIPRDLTELARTLDSMRAGHRLYLERCTWRTLWPRPSIFQTDDYLSDRERAERWCAVFDCTIHENFDPPRLVIEKRRRT